MLGFYRLAGPQTHTPVRSYSCSCSWFDHCSALIVKCHCHCTGIAVDYSTLSLQCSAVQCNDSAVSVSVPIARSLPSFVSAAAVINLALPSLVAPGQDRQVQCSVLKYRALNENKVQWIEGEYSGVNGRRIQCRKLQFRRIQISLVEYSATV